MSGAWTVCARITVNVTRPTQARMPRRLDTRCMMLSSVSAAAGRCLVSLYGLTQAPYDCGGAACYTLGFCCNVCKVEFAWSPWTPNAKPRRRGRGCKSTGVERGDRMILLALLLFVLLTRKKRTKLKIEIDL